MKVRNGFVSNSSSTSFMITNTSNKKKTLVDFVTENPQLVEQFNREYDYNYTQEQMLKGAKAEGIKFLANEKLECVFGDEDGTIIGAVFDYILRNGGSSKSFDWNFNEYRR